MPRNYKRKTGRVRWSQDQLAKAKEAVNGGMSVKRAALNYGVPRTTLQDHVCGKVARSKLGPIEPVFTPEQEEELVLHLLDLESRFYGITMEDVRKLAYELAVKNKISHPFNTEKQMAGRDWLKGFLKRNPNLAFRKAEATSAARARAFNKPTVDAFFKMYEDVLTRMGFTADRIFNADETGISTVCAFYSQYMFFRVLTKLILIFRCLPAKGKLQQRKARSRSESFRPRNAVRRPPSL